MQDTCIALESGGWDGPRAAHAQSHIQCWGAPAPGVPSGTPTPPGALFRHALWTSPNGSGGALNTPNGAFKGGPKADLRRPPVQDPGNRGLGGAVRPLQSVI